MIAIGLDLPPGIFKEVWQYSLFIKNVIHDLLVLLMSFRQITRISFQFDWPLINYGQKGTISTKYHPDFNFLTIHGRSRYPSLDIWARNTAKRVRLGVKILPGNNFVVQAGKQLEHITGGLIKGGFHEVVVNDRTLAVSDFDANILLCTHLAFFIIIRLLNDGRWNSQIDLFSESHQPFSGTFLLYTIWFLSPR